MVTVTVTPAVALLDEELQMAVGGLRPGERVTLRAAMTDFVVTGDRWEAEATFVAGPGGTVNPAVQEPVAGSYTGVEPMGLLTAMKLTTALKPDMELMGANRSTRTYVTITAEVDGQTVGTARVERIYRAPGTRVQDVREQGLVGEFYTPEGGGRRPCIIVLGGSEGGYRGVSYLGALLAAHGYASLVLAYFGVEHLPSTLTNIPLEYFKTAIDWVQARPEVNGEQVGLMAISRGGEAALQIASVYPEIKAVVGYAAGAVRMPGLLDKPLPKNVPAWTYQGKPLPFVPWKLTPGAIFSLLGDMVKRRPLAFAPLYEASMRNKAAVAQAAIAVERINGPVLLFSGANDRLWPAPTLSEMAIQRLARHNHLHPYRHICLEGVGHSVQMPYAPCTEPPGTMIALYGEPGADARGARQAWTTVLAFWRETFPDERRSYL